MIVLSPAAWGAAVNYDSWDDPFTPDDGVALHHGGSGDYPAHNPPYTVEKESALLRSWEQFHLSKGWRGLAYGWAVGQTGTLYRVRGWNKYGAHTGDVDGDGIANNVEIVPILFIGSGDQVRLSPAAQQAVEWLRRNVIEQRSPAARRLYGHREITPTTSCPGRFGMEYVEAHRVLEDESVTPEQMQTLLEAIAAVPRATWADKPGNQASAWQTLIRTKANTDILVQTDIATQEDIEAAVDVLIDQLPGEVLDALYARLDPDG